MTILNTYYKQYLNFFCISLLFIFGICFTSNAQFGTKAEIKNIDFNLVDNKIIINYDLVKARRSDIFDVDVCIFSTSGYKIDAPTLEGKFTNVSKGKGHEIKWHLGKDYNFFDDNIYVELTAFHNNHKKVKKVTRIEALVKSTIWPGWGSAQTTLRKINFGKGIIAYGFLTSSIVTYELSRSGIVAEKDYRNPALGLLSMAAIVWIWDYGKILFSPNVSSNIKLDIEAANYKNNLAPMLSLKINL